MPITIGTTTIGSVANITLEEDPIVCKDGQEAFAFLPSRHWYRFIGNGQIIRVGACQSPQTFISMFSGSCFHPTCIVTNNDVCEAIVNTIAGEDYYILVNSDDENVALVLNEAEVPVNTPVPVNLPVVVPVKPPAKAPVPSPAKTKTPPPVKAPVKAPSKDKAPVKVPVKAPVKAPIKGPAKNIIRPGIFSKHRRSLKEMNVRHLVESQTECSNAEYDMYLVSQGAHFAGLAVPKDVHSQNCTSVGFHAQVGEDSRLKKSAVHVSINDLSELEEEHKLHLGSKPLGEIVKAFEAAPVNKEGVLYDAIRNNCVALLRNMADHLNISVDKRMVGFITKKLTSSASEHIVEKMKQSPALHALYQGSRRWLNTAVGTDDLVARVIQLYV